MITAFFSEVLQVLLVSLLFGAGLPALFAVGVRALGDEIPGTARTTRRGKAIAWTMFALCGAVALFGILTIVAKGFGWDL